MNSNTFAVHALVPIGSIQVEGYLLPNTLWTNTNKFGISKTQAIMLAYPKYDRSQAAKKYIQTVDSKIAKTLAPQGLLIHQSVPTEKDRPGIPQVDLLPVDYLLTFLKICKKLGSKAADQIIDDLAGLSLQQIFSDAFQLSFSATNRQNFLKEWQSVRELAKAVHAGFKNACIEKKHPGHLVHDYITSLIFGDTAAAARAKALVDENSDPTVGLNHQEDIINMRKVAQVKVKYTGMTKGTWEQQVERACSAVMS